MAKKAKTEGVQAREARLGAEAAAEARAAGAAADEARQASEEAERVAAAGEEAARRKAERDAPKPKRPRFVRAGREARPAAVPAPLPPRNTTPAGRLLSKVVVVVPKDAPDSGLRRGRG